MKTYLNTETGLLTLAAGATTGIRRIDAKRGDLFLLEVVPSGTITGATGVFAAKSTYSGDPVALASSWDDPETESTGYLFTIDLNTTDLNALFTSEIAEVTLLAEITWSLAGAIRSTQTLSLVVARDVWRGDEADPTAASDLKATQAEAEAGTENTKWVTPLRVAQAIAALAPEGGGGGSETYELKSASFTAEIGKAYSLDTTSGSFDVTLPESPAGGKTVCFCDARGTWHTNPPTFLRNGNKIEGQEVNFTDSAQGTFFCMVFIDAATGWRILESGTKPQNLIVPEITGQYVGVAFTTTNGSWTGSPTAFSYQWQISADGSTGWADIEGATGATYTPVSLDETKFVRVLVTATNANGSSLHATSLASVEIEVLPFPAGALAFWKLADLTDASGNTNTLTNNDSVTFAAGKIGNAAVFDGTNYLSLSETTLTSPVSISMWVEASSYESTKVFFAHLDWVISVAEGSVKFGPNGPGGPVKAIPATEGDWFHVVAVDDGTNYNVYINGVGPETTLIPSGTLGGGQITIGTMIEWMAGAFTGGVDACGIWPRALSNIEVATLYNGGAGLEPA